MKSLIPSAQERVLFDKLLSGVCFLNLDRQITYWNEAAEYFLGYSSGEVLGSPCCDWINGFRTPEHVDAHLLTCMIALILMRIIQKKIRDTGKTARDDVYWNVGLSGERIQKALNKWKVDALPDDLYRFMDMDDPDLALILKAFDIEIPPKLYRRAELKAIKTGTKIFM